MPLAAGSDQATISKNIHELSVNGSRKRSHDQIVAIALSNADRHPRAALGGGIGRSGFGSMPHATAPHMMSPSEGSPWWTRSSAHEMTASTHGGGGIGIPHMAGGGMMSSSEASPWWERSESRIADVPFHGGLIGGSGAGRTDRLPLSLGSGSHVIPADAVSGAGQHATNFGANAIQDATRTGPYNVPVPHMVHGRGPPAAPHLSGVANDPGPTGIEKSMTTGLAEGGRTPPQTSILAASGEMVIPPEDVIAIGQRGIRDGRGKRGESAADVGHRLLDEMIARIRKFNIEWLENAPLPKRKDGGRI